MLHYTLLFCLFVIICRCAWSNICAEVYFTKDENDGAWTVWPRGGLLWFTVAKVNDWVMSEPPTMCNFFQIMCQYSTIYAVNRQTWNEKSSYKMAYIYRTHVCRIIKCTAMDVHFHSETTSPTKRKPNVFCKHTFLLCGMNGKKALIKTREQNIQSISSLEQ